MRPSFPHPLLVYKGGRLKVRKSCVCISVQYSVFFLSLLSSVYFYIQYTRVALAYNLQVKVIMLRTGVVLLLQINQMIPQTKLDNNPETPFGDGIITFDRTPALRNVILQSTAL